MIQIVNPLGIKGLGEIGIVGVAAASLWATANAPQGAAFQFTLPVGSERMA